MAVQPPSEMQIIVEIMIPRGSLSSSSHWNLAWVVNKLFHLHVDIIKTLQCNDRLDYVADSTPHYEAPKTEKIYYHII